MSPKPGQTWELLGKRADVFKITNWNPEKAGWQGDFKAYNANNYMTVVMDEVYLMSNFELKEQP